MLGHSWGGMLAQAYAVKHPQTITRIILADTFSSISDCNETLRRMREAVPPAVRAVYEKWESAGLYKGRDRYPEEYQAALVIVGASDMPTIVMAEKTASLLPNARIEVFEYSRHFPFIEEPQKFLQVMRAFFAQTA
jgi:pimeloyl-ACP methyl ester carboxylesterase